MKKRFTRLVTALALSSVPLLATEETRPVAEVAPAPIGSAAYAGAGHAKKVDWSGVAIASGVVAITVATLIILARDHKDTNH